MQSDAAKALLAWFLALNAILSQSASALDSHAKITFSRDVLPILSDNCFHCHGPDEKARKAKLRLDVREGALKVAKPGASAASELLKRVRHGGDERMPPAETGRKLTAEQVSLLARWIDEGMPWGRHWAFEPPVTPTIPALVDAPTVRNPIDAFVLERLRKERRSLAREAEKPALIRRATLDLTGLPPTTAEVDAFIADGRPDAYERVVERLLASPRYGERMAMDWLDQARFADTNGYQNDFARSMWPWRDWVIDAFNRNMPYDRFIVEQTAGDLLPNAGLAQRVATGFNRNNRTVTEAGSIDEEWRIENAVDRIETTATVFLGLTVGCCRCHDHKFDPISQREFYSLLAYYNSVAERGVYTETPGNVPPLATVKSPADDARLQQLESVIRAAEASLKRESASLPAKQVVWEAAQRKLSKSTAIGDWLLRFPLDHSIQPEVRSGQKAPIAARSGKPVWTNGPTGKSLRFSERGADPIEAGQAVSFERTQPFSYGGWVRLKGDGAILSKMDDAGAYRGFDLLATNDRLQVHIVHDWPGDAIKVETESPILRDAWMHVFATYDGSSKAGGVAVYVNGQPARLITHNDALRNSIRTNQPLRIGKRSTAFPLRGDLADVRFYDRRLSAAEVRSLADEPAASLVHVPSERRTPDQKASLAAFFADRFATDYVTARAALANAKREKEEFEKRLPTVMVMADLPKPRPTFVLKRGQYDLPDKNQQVQPGVPACLSPLPSGAPTNRLGLAHWLVDSKNPLTARVAVNRFWEHYFGVGLVKTSENFGVQGERPSHPELLDWLAIEFQRSGWNVKAMQRLIVTSATYRQSSAETPWSLQNDPENRLLSRGPRFRLPAEVVRDNALAVSGLLVEKLGGPSIRPYQPAGLWEELAGGAGEGPYRQDSAPDLYRRSLYIYRKRTVPHPAMSNFDAPSRETCQVKRARTNTPLQALELLNDVTYVEAARRLAQRMITEVKGGDAERIAFAFRRAVARRPSKVEEAVLVRGLARYREHFRRDPAAARQLVMQGASVVDSKLDPIELAAFSATASVILNLDETITKE